VANAYIEITLGGKKAAGRKAIIDIEDYDSVIAHRWHIYEDKSRKGRVRGPYAITNIYKRSERGDIIRKNGVAVQTALKMHKLLTGFSQTDHKNHDGLDNRRKNLRPGEGSRNPANKRTSLKSSSKYKGVSWHSRINKWQAEICVNYNRKFLGYYDYEDEAGRAYDTAAREYFGEYAFLNFPEFPALVTTDLREAAAFMEQGR
jgi:hypothetical protein